MSADARAGAMRRNSRKRRTGMVRQALRLYHGGDPEERDVRHHEAALAAAARLGPWKEGAAVLGEVERAAADGRAEAARKEKKERGEHRVEMTEGMILSFVRACIRGGEGDPLARREPLDVAAEVIANLETLYGLSLNAAMVNPLAAAYQKLGLYSEAASLLSLLSDRTGPRLDEAGIKDGASYALVVGGHVAQRDWIAALERLREMREAGACVRRRDLDRWGVMIESQGRSKRIQNLLVIEEKEGVEAI
uniref:Pentacotripeptide-repeat region of PRORP domain-containing protein n=1 Tax=Corethron hystrix TaxID=216773 RepID=A0A7S1BKC2_9STRA|mmetsp:Transcript_31666/g.72612  ORF Transcript_31666/g.72612 Transcript_31666/m.72612 type:complete len:250 (+) Transcript_31666:612-1361(+)